MKKAPTVYIVIKALYTLLSRCIDPWNNPEVWVDNLFLQTLLGQESQGFRIIMQSRFVMVGLKYMIKWGRMTIAI